MESSKSMDPDIRALFSYGGGSKRLIDRQEVEGALTSLCLTSVSYGGYLLIMRSECDMILSDEPHIALIMWLNLETGRFFARIWNRTVTTGRIKDMAEFLEICRAHFMSGKPCLGLPVINDMISDRPFMVSHSPIPRRISKKCKKTLGQGTHIDAQSCPECLKLEDNKELADYKVECKKEVFTNEELDHGCEGDVRIHPEVDYMDAEQKIQFDGDDPLFYDTSITNSFAEDDMKYKCPACNQIFNNRNFASHMSKNHPDLHPDFIDEDYESFRVEDEKGVNEFTLDLFSNEADNGSYQDSELRAKKQYNYKRFNCPWCNRGDKKYYTRAYLEIHMKIRHFWGTFSCLHCEHKADFAADLIEHMKEEAHLEKTDVQCPQCKDNIPLTEIQCHYENCISEQTLVCPWCPNTLYDRSQELEFIAHKKKVHLWGNFSCKVCNFKTELSKDLIKHVGEHRETTSVECPECCLELTSLEIESHYKACVTKAINNTCPWCSKKFESHSACHTHKKMIHLWNRFSCEKCAHKSNFSEELIDHMNKEDHKGPVSCPNCKTMIPMAEFVSHYKQCLRGKWLKCQWCPKVFRSYNGTFFIHRRKVHFWGIFKCPQCDIVKNFAEDLLSHMKEENHFKNINIKCPYCANMIPFIDIVAHYKDCIADLGKGEGYSKSAKCLKCKQKFPKNVILSHQKTCRPVLKRGRKWACPYCDLKLGVKLTYEHKRHKVMTHFWGNFVCPNCGIKCGFAKDLLQHMDNEMHDAPVRCPECMDLIEKGVIEEHYKACAGTWTFSRDKKEVLTEQSIEEGNMEQDEQKSLYRYENNFSGYRLVSMPIKYKCPACNQIFNKRNFASHMSTNHPDLHPDFIDEDYESFRVEDVKGVDQFTLGLYSKEADNGSYQGSEPKAKKRYNYT